MESNEIKKALYKEKPNAECTRVDATTYYYQTTLSNGEKILFQVPQGEVASGNLRAIEPAQLLIRWLVKKENPSD